MDPPSYDEARLHPPTLSAHALHYPPPPSYDASLPSPSTPPPTYGEAVTIQPDPYPVLTVPTVTHSVSQPPQTTGIIIHPTTQIGVNQSVNVTRSQPAVQSQPQSTTHLKDTPGIINCPHCHRTVTTKVTHVPGKSAWCLCILLSVMGLVCGICLIPLLVPGLQDVHHSCPYCENQIHVYSR